nr:uncharacterized protein I206_04018 [Kwoniella pini CBS 10737]OCF49497.1 hypothetical protein I206_04018 [Kwoniella pini CBS 10737]
MSSLPTNSFLSSQIPYTQLDSQKTHSQSQFELISSQSQSSYKCRRRHRKRTIDTYIGSETECEDEVPLKPVKSRLGSSLCPIDFTQTEEESPLTPARKKGRNKKEECGKRKRRIELPSPSPETEPSIGVEPIPQGWTPLIPGILRYSQIPSIDSITSEDGYKGESYIQSQVSEDDEDELILEEHTESHHFNTCTNANGQTKYTSASNSYNANTPTDHAAALSDLREDDERASREEDDLNFEALMKRGEGKRQYEILAEQEQQRRSLKWLDNQSQSQNPDNSQTSTASSKSLREVEGLTDKEQARRSKAITFLENIVLDYHIQLLNSQQILRSRRLNRNKRSPKKKNKVDEDQEESQEPLILDESQDEEEDVAEPSQEKSQEEPGVALRLKNRKTGNLQQISFPDDPLSNMSGPKAIEKQARLIKIVVVLYEAILTHTVVTLRDIFYRDKALFKTQPVVDKIVDDLIATAGMKRKDFCVCASAKGLIAAKSLKIIRRSGEVVELSSSTATLIDPIERIDHVESPGTVQWVLVVEKDAVFQTLCSTRLLEDERLGAGVLITGKGFPDLASKQMLRLISKTFPDARINALVDADPHGISILSTYAFGSANSRHSKDHARLALGDKIQWMGLKATDIKR